MLDVIIDLSHYNTVTSFNDIKSSGIVGIVHKASQGTSYVDPCYAERRRQALDAGLLFGAYHFGEKGMPADQVSHFLDTVCPTPQDLLVLDWEPCDPTTMTLEEAEAFAWGIYAHTGWTVGLYSGQSFCTDVLATCEQTPLQRCWLWLARYSDEPPEVPPLWPVWTLWQWTAQGTVPGIEGYCDRDRFNGDLAGLMRLWGVDATYV